MFTSLQELLDFSKKDAELDGDYNEDVFEKRNLFISTYKRVATILEKFSIKIIFACRGDAKNEVGENVEARGKQIETLCEDYFSGCEVGFEFWGAEEILKAYRKRADYSLTLDVKECLTHGKQMVVLASLKDYFDFITYDDKKMRKYLFDSNVRDFMGINAVNGDILGTLNDRKNEEDFWWLNNGITILCTTAIAIGKSISITNVQIVNGLQTSECIFRYFSENGDKEDDRVVLIKILPCDSSAIADDITRSTNNQTEVQSASLRATDKIQEDIEDILKKEGLYYERRINYYLNQGVPIECIFSPLYLAAGYMALVLKRPYRAVALKQKFMRKKESYEEIFSEKDNVLIWPVIAKVMRKTDENMSDLRQNGSGDRFLRNVRYQVSFLTISRLLGSFAYSFDSLMSMDLSKYTFAEVERTWTDIQKVVVAVNRRANWRNRDASLNISNEVAKMEGITGVNVIDKRKVKASDLTEEYLEIIKRCLPDQPWPPNVHIDVAREMGISHKEASIAIGELMRRKMVKKQKDGLIIEG